MCMAKLENKKRKERFKSMFALGGRGGSVVLKLCSMGPCLGAEGFLSLSERTG